MSPEELSEPAGVAELLGKAAVGADEERWVTPFVLLLDKST